VSIEQSHGKARPTLARADELPRVLPSADHRHRGRDAHGRFVAGNRAATHRGVKQALGKLVGRYVRGADDDAMGVASDAASFLRAKLLESPAPDSPSVRSMLALASTHEALAAFWFARAMVAGLDTAAGVECQAHATKHGQRAERLAVTAWDLASRLAQRRPKSAPRFMVKRAAKQSPTQPGRAATFEHADDTEPMRELTTRLRALAGGRPAPIVSDDEGSDGS
jgi:hypothetical protein